VTTAVTCSTAIAAVDYGPAAGAAIRNDGRDEKDHHCTTISLNSTALIRLGAMAALTRRVNSSFSR
jgi:hypothetical protein